MSAAVSAGRGRPRTNHVGRQYGPITIIGSAEDFVTANHKVLTRVLCRCVCGREAIARTNYLHWFAAQTHCVCDRKRGRTPSKIIPLVFRAMMEGATNNELKEEFNITHQYVSILRRRLAELPQAVTDAMTMAVVMERLANHEPVVPTED